MSHVPLYAENCMQNVKKKSKFYCGVFSHYDGEKYLDQLNTSDKSYTEWDLKKQ